MIRFSHPSDRTYNAIESRIVDMVRSQLEHGNRFSVISGLQNISLRDLPQPGNDPWADDNRASLARIPASDPPPYTYSYSFPIEDSRSTRPVGDNNPSWSSSGTAQRSSIGPVSRRAASPEAQGTYTTNVDKSGQLDNSFGVNMEKFKALRTFDTVFVIDDSGSMQKPTDQKDPTGPDRWASMQPP